MSDKDISKKSSHEGIKLKGLEIYHKSRERVVPWVRQHPKLSAALGAVVVVLLLTISFGGGEEDLAQDYFEATRGDFLVSIVEGGTLEAVNEIIVRNEVPGNSRIVYIVPEGTFVEKGQLVVQLDTEEAEENLNQAMIRYEDDKADAIKAETDVTIIKSTVESQIRKAELDVQFAEMDLQKFEEIEREQEIRNAQISIITAQESLKLAEERLEWSEKLTDEGFETKSNLDRDRLSVTNQSLGLEKAKSSERMLNEYDLEKMEARYQSAVEESIEELERVKQQGQSKISQAIAQLQIEKRKLEMSEAKLAQRRDFLEKTKIYAPQSGLIIYAGSSNRYSNESIIEEGAMIRMRQAIVKIPDTSEMKVIVKVHESHVNQISKGQRAYVVLDALPDNRYAGTVSKISLLPDPQSRWGNSNLKVYSTEILIKEKLPDVKPGASARAEIIITRLENVITVPIQSVTTIQGKQVCYVKGFGDPKPVEVEIGLFNNKFIEIKSGLKPGDRVLLAPPLETGVDLGGALLQEGDKVDLPESQPKPDAQIDSPINQRSGSSEEQTERMPRALTGEEPRQRPDPGERDEMRREARERRDRSGGEDGGGRDGN